MTGHICFMDDGATILCLCVHGVDHAEKDFDVLRKSHTEVIDSENPGEGPRVVTRRPRT